MGAFRRSPLQADSETVVLGHGTDQPGWGERRGWRVIFAQPRQFLVLDNQSGRRAADPDGTGCPEFESGHSQNLEHAQRGSAL